MKKFVSLLLAVIMVFSCFAVTTLAEEGTTEETTGGTGEVVPTPDVSEEDNSITVKMMNYNVAGMPNFSGKDVPLCQQIIGNYIVENGFDIVATQEDFGYNRKLYESMTGYDYRTCHTGSIPGGDGLNIYTKTMPIYNEKREQWFRAYGSISEGDLLTPKGLLYAAIDIGDGIIVDFYNIHADAFDTKGSQEARYSNYMQLATLIEQNYKKNNRPVIVTGDFNHYLHATEVNSDQYKIFHRFCGLKDDAGADLSDHAAAEVNFKFTKTESFVENTGKLEVKILTNPLSIFFNMIRWIFKDLGYILSHISELVEFLG